MIFCDMKLWIVMVCLLYFVFYLMRCYGTFFVNIFHSSSIGSVLLLYFVATLWITLVFVTIECGNFMRIYCIFFKLIINFCGMKLWLLVRFLWWSLVYFMRFYSTFSISNFYLLWGVHAWYIVKKIIIN